MLHVAGRMMHERGYTAVGVADICREAESKKGSFYHYFDSKQSLAIEMLQESWQAAQLRIFDEVFAEPGGEVDGSASDAFVRYGNLLADNLEGYSAARGVIPGCRFGNFANELGAVDPDIAECLGSVFDDMISYFASAIAQGQRQGEFDADLDPRHEAVAVLALMEGLMTLAKTTGQPALLRRLGQDVHRLLTGDRT